MSKNETMKRLLSMAEARRNDSLPGARCLWLGPKLTPKVEERKAA